MMDWEKYPTLRECLKAWVIEVKRGLEGENMLMGEDVLQLVRQARIAWLGGFYGSGKTALASRIAVEFVERGWADHIVGNFPSVLHTDVETIPCKDAVIILDEAGVWLDDKDFNKMVAYLRKMNLTVVLPSVLPVSTKARTINFQKTFNGYSVGLPFWQYTVNLEYMNLTDKMRLTWWNPPEMFGLYDTDYKSGVEDGIKLVRWMVDAARGGEKRLRDAVEGHRAKEKSGGLVLQGFGEEVAAKESETASKAAIDDDSMAWAGIQSMESGGRLVDDLQEATRRMETTLSAFKKVSKRNRRR